MTIKGLFIHASLNENGPEDIIRSKFISSGGDKKPKPLAFQIPGAQDIPTAFCSFYCPGYETSYQQRGVIFEPLSEPVYASPADNFEYLRGGRWIPGIERFVFKSIEEMLAKYPTKKDFKEDFRRYFQSLAAEQVFPRMPFQREPELSKSCDYCNFDSWINQLDCNEIGFRAPLNIKVIDTFYSREELDEKAKKLII